ncbi:DMT family transporter [Kineosporia sp. R_H_3]|uniref:DMT family transporter n=1 Tax=Kineosporia sp. R_H_3 TaxID=1961848 RepID=UPI000B4BAFCC|nr:DMT family transporter [Kineosporia sp. R_H_3]
MAAVLALLSSLLWGTADFGGGLVTRRLPALAVVAWSQAAALVLVGAVALFTGASDAPTGWLPWAVMAGVAGPLGLVLFYTALSTGTMGVVSPIAALGGVVPVVAGLLSGDRPSLLQWLGMAVALGGAVLASGPELSGGTKARAVVLAALAGLCFGVCVYGIARGAESSSVMTLVGMRVVSVGLAVALGLALRTTGGVSRADLPALAAVGLADAGANILFGLAASRDEMVSIVSVLGTLYPVATVLLARYVLGERMLGVQRAGVGVAMAGVVLLAVG